MRVEETRSAGRDGAPLHDRHRRRQYSRRCDGRRVVEHRADVRPAEVPGVRLHVSVGAHHELGVGSVAVGPRSRADRLAGRVVVADAAPVRAVVVGGVGVRPEAPGRALGLARRGVRLRVVAQLVRLARQARIEAGEAAESNVAHGREAARSSSGRSAERTCTPCSSRRRAGSTASGRVLVGQRPRAAGHRVSGERPCGRVRRPVVRERRRRRRRRQRQRQRCRQRARQQGRSTPAFPIAFRPRGRPSHQGGPSGQRTSRERRPVAWRHARPSLLGLRPGSRRARGGRRRRGGPRRHRVRAAGAVHGGPAGSRTI